jgi:hypothetical protein
MPNKKTVTLQEFGIIHLPNPDLTYIRNPERNKIMFMPFHLLKTYIRNPERETKLCLCPSTSLVRTDAKSAPRAHICACEAGGWQVAKNVNLICQTVGAQIFSFYQN